MDSRAPHSYSLALDKILKSWSSSITAKLILRTEFVLLLLLVTLLFFRNKLQKLIRGKLKGDEGSGKEVAFVRVQHGPIKLPAILEGCYTLVKVRRDGIVAFKDWTEKYGPVFELPFFNGTVVVVMEPNIIQKLLQSTDPGHLNKPRFIYDRILVECFRDGLVSADYNIWFPHRKMISRAFTYRSLRTYLKFMNVHAKSLASNLMKMRKTGTGGELVAEGKSMYDMIYFHSLKIITQILMGEDATCSDDDTVFFHKQFKRAKDIIVHRFLHAELMLEPIWALHPMKREFRRIFKELSDFVNKKTATLKEKRDLERQQGVSRPRTEEDGEDEDPNANLDPNDVGEKPFRCLIEEMLECDASDEEIFNEVATFMSAGHETMTISINFMMWHLACNPQEQARCREEVDAILDGKAISQQGNNSEFLSMEDLYGMKHLERCILESIRLSPSIPLFLRRLDKPLKISEEMEFKVGTNIMLCPWVVHRNPEYFPDPDRFDPWRHENVKSRVPGSYFPFSLGMRACIGYKLSIVQMKVIIGWMLRHFELHTTDKPEDLKMKFELTLVPHRMFNIYLKARTN